MLESRYYAIEFLSKEWCINTSVTFIIGIFFFYISKSIFKKNKIHLFNYFLGTILLGRFFWFQWYHYNIGIWSLEWSLPLQMCSFSSLLSGILPFLENTKVPKKYKQILFEFLFYFSIGAFYGILTPVYTAGNEGLIYYEYYVSHGGIVFTVVYFLFILKYKLTKNSWLKIFLYSQLLLIAIHLINTFIGGQANYFYTVEPPIADNPLVIGQYPMHIILLDLFALIHFYIFYRIEKKINV